MTKHTPGPWTLRSYVASDSVGWIVRIEGERDIAIDHYSAESEWNARLIAAAPDLLDALQRLVGDGTRFCDCEQPSCGECHAHAVIKKATGER